MKNVLWQMPVFLKMQEDRPITRTWLTVTEETNGLAVWINWATGEQPPEGIKDTIVHFESAHWKKDYLIRLVVLNQEAFLSQQPKGDPSLPPQCRQRAEYTFTDIVHTFQGFNWEATN